MKPHEIRAEIRALQWTRRQLKERIDFLRKQLPKEDLELVQEIKHHPNGTVSVPGERVAPLIRGWIDSGRSLGALERLSGVSDRTLRNALNGDNIADTSVDKLLIALGKEHLYNDIVPMPPESHYYEE